MPMLSLVAHRPSVLFGLAVFLAVAGCSRAPQAPPPPPPLVVTVAGGEDLNGGGNAAVVRVYQLGGDANFRRAPVQTFWQDDEQALGAELVGTKREILLFPNTTETVPIELEDAAAFLAVAADLREPDAENWRAIYPISEVRGRSVGVVVGEDRLFVRVE